MTGTKILAMALALIVSATTYAAHDEFVRVEVKGTLHHDFKGDRATIKADGFNYDLDLGNNRDMHRQAEKFDRQVVSVSGRLLVEQGRDGCPRLTVVADRFTEVPSSVRYDRSEYREERPVVRERYVEQPRERVIIREEKDQPIIKLPFVEIND